MSLLKSEEDLVKLRESGKRLSKILLTVADGAQPGVSLATLNDMTDELIRRGGDIPALLNYKPSGATRPFPASVCISVNEEVVHGIPNEDPHELKEGDLVSFDACLNHQGLITDMALTVGVGTIDEKAKKLLSATKEALHAGIKMARAGNHIGDIGAAIDEVAMRTGFGNVYELGGHGVGYAVHQRPFISNIGGKGTGEPLVSGMILALEPMFTEGSEKVKLLKDGYTFVTRDGSRSAHFEHTIFITENDPEILTVL